MSTYYISAEDRQICLDLMDQKEKVRSIKHARQASGCGLKEAKDWVESGCAMYPFTLMGDFWKYSEETIETLSDRLFSLVEEIVEVHGKMKKLGEKNE